jgi:ribose transport system permease protein
MNAVAAPLRWTPVSRRRMVKRNAWTLGVYLLLFVLLIVYRIANGRFDSFDAQTVVGTAVPLALAAMGQAVIVLGGGIDLSIGPVMSLVNVLAATWMVHAGTPEALLLSLLLIGMTALIGAVTGAVITWTRVPDIIVTLATSFIWAGVALQIMGTPGQGGAPIAFNNLVNGTLFGAIPEGLFVLIAALIVIWLPFRRSRYGLAVYALGSNRTAAYLSGVSVGRARIIAYAVGGIFTALAGLMLTALQGGTGDPLSGTPYTLNSVAAIVLGGVTLAGGRGGLLGPLAAALVLEVISGILAAMNVDPNWAQVIQGAIVIGIVMAAGFLTIRRRT